MSLDLNELVLGGRRNGAEAERLCPREQRRAWEPSDSSWEINITCACWKREKPSLDSQVFTTNGTQRWTQDNSFYLACPQRQLALAAQSFEPPEGLSLRAALVVSGATGTPTSFYDDFALCVTYTRGPSMDSSSLIFSQHVPGGLHSRA